MIKLVRLDERLIHGQIAIKWSRHTGVDRIIVANDSAANNPIVKKSLLMAAPQTCKTAIKSVDDTITMLKNPKAKNHDILILCSNPTDLLHLIKNIDDVETVNIGNYGRIAPNHPGETRKAYAPNLYLYDDEKELLKNIKDCGFDAIYQTTPEDPIVSVEKVLKD